MTARQTSTDQINVRVTLFADLRRFLTKGVEGAQTYVLPAGSTVADLLATIGIPADDEVTVGLNGEQAARENVLRDGDDAVMFSPMEGG